MGKGYLISHRSYSQGWGHPKLCKLLHSIRESPSSANNIHTLNSIQHKAFYTKLLLLSHPPSLFFWIFIHRYNRSTCAVVSGSHRDNFPINAGTPYASVALNNHRPYKFIYRRDESFHKSLLSLFSRSPPISLQIAGMVCTVFFCHF